MCSCRSPLRRACPPPHIEKAFDLRWYKVTRRPRRGRAYRCTIPLHPDPLPPCEGGRGCREWGDGKRDILSAPAPRSRCAEGCYRLKRKSVSGNGISRGGAEEPLISSYEIKPAIAGVTKPSPALVLIQSTVSQTTPPSFSMMPVPSTWRSPGGAPMTATVS